MSAAGRSALAPVATPGGARDATPDAAGEVWRRRSPRLVRMFARYLRWYAGGVFHGVRIARDSAPELARDRAVIVYSNHPGWWDPALFIVVADALYPARASFGPMDQAALGRYAILQRMGVYGVDLALPRGAARFLRVGLGLLERRAILWITAQGTFVDARVRPVRLRAGVAHLARRMPTALIVPLAVEYVFWEERKPEALLRFGAPVAWRDDTVAGWTTRLEAGLTATMDRLAGEAIARDPAAFTTVRSGATGIGGVYDAWRWARARWRGEPFHAGHSARPPA